MPFAGAKPADLIAGLVAQMWFVSAVARRAGRDPGRPDVPQFGQDIHYLDIHQLIPSANETDDSGETSKREVLGATWPSADRHGPVRRALANYLEGLQQQEFRAIIFDYDGTLCGSGSSEPPPKAILEQITKLLAHDVQSLESQAAVEVLSKRISGEVSPVQHGPRSGWHSMAEDGSLTSRLTVPRTRKRASFSITSPASFGS